MKVIYYKSQWVCPNKWAKIAKFVGPSTADYLFFYLFIYFYYLFILSTNLSCGFGWWFTSLQQQIHKSVSSECASGVTDYWIKNNKTK